MATKKISELSGFVPDLADEVEVRDVSAGSAGSKKATVEDLLSLGGIMGTIVVTDAMLRQASIDYAVEIMPAVPGSFYMILGGGAWSSIVAPYTNQDNLREITIGYDDVNYDAIQPLFFPENDPKPAFLLQSNYYQAIVPGDASSLVVSTSGVQGYPLDGIVGKNLALYVDNNGDGEFTGGDPANKLTILLRYLLVTP